MSKVWFITGAGSGMGAETAKAALAAGDRVVATGRDLDKVRAAIGREPGDTIAYFRLDVADAGQAMAAAEEAVRAFGRIDVLVNNAGYCILGNFEEITQTEFEQQFATNFWGVSNVLRAVLPTMRRQRSGYILNISSVAGVVGQKHCSAYAASKFALEGLSFALANEVGKFGIRVTVVEPGFFRTDFLDSRNARYATSSIADYAQEGSAETMYSSFNGQQSGDPSKLGPTLVNLSRLAEPPAIFAAGGDALAMITPVVEARLKDMRDHEALSRAAGGEA